MQCPTLRNREAGSNLAGMGRCTAEPFSSICGDATVKACGLIVVMLPE